MMNNEILHFIEKQSDAFIEQAEAKPWETLEVKLNKQMGVFWFSSPINLSEERKWLLAETSFEAKNCVFNGIDENNIFPITRPNRWIAEGSEEIVDKLKKIIRA